MARIHRRTVQKDLHDPDKHDGVKTHLEPDILECEVKRALKSISTAIGSNGIPIQLFQILKDDAVKVLHSISQQIWKTQQWPPDWKRSGFIPIPKKGNAKKCSNYCIIALISHTSNITLKILVYELRTSKCSKTDLEKAGEPDIKLPTSTGSQKEQDNSRKTSTYLQ